MNLSLSRNAPQITAHGAGAPAVGLGERRLCRRRQCAADRQRGALRNREFMPGRSACSTWRPAIFMRPWRRPVAGVMSPPRMCLRTSPTQPRSASRRRPWACASWTAMPRPCLSLTRASMPWFPSFGAMFSQDQERAASEMVRVCRRGRLLGLANWTPDGFVGQLFKVLAQFSPAGGAAQVSCGWGTPERLQELFGAYGNLDCSVKNVAFRARTPMDWVDTLRASYAPGPARLWRAGYRRETRPAQRAPGAGAALQPRPGRQHGAGRAVPGSGGPAPLKPRQRDRRNPRASGG